MFEIEDYYAQAPFLANAARFAAKLLEEGMFAGELLDEADIFLQLDIEQPDDEASRTKLKE